MNTRISPYGKRYLLVGANVRFLAENAVRHGHDVFTVDYYGDWDTRKLSPNRSIVRDGDGVMKLDSLVELARGLENSGVVYGPGFENSVEALLTLGGVGPLVGCGLETVRKTRAPEEIRRAAASWGFQYAEVAPNLARTPNAKEKWLLKPLDGLGGEGISFKEGPAPVGGRPYYTQRYVPGMPSSATVVSNGSEAAVIGIMTQIIGDESFGASGFRFVGNIWPHPFAAECAREVANIAEALTLEFDIKGLWGFDFIYDGSVTLVEINPRPSAGAGLVGKETLNDLLGMHITGAASGSGLILDSFTPDGFVGQARVFARTGGVFNGSEEWLAKDARDIPEDGSIIQPGAPALTVHASDQSYKGVMAKLCGLADELQSSLSGAQPAPAM